MDKEMSRGNAVQNTRRRAVDKYQNPDIRKNIWVAATVGVWLFYIQNQFKGVYWERAKDWNFIKAGLEGSSFYKLPKLLQ